MVLVNWYLKIDDKGILCRDKLYHDTHQSCYITTFGVSLFRKAK